ncbi:MULTISPECIES: hypothetical protein [Aerococcus]|uniref:PepSY domain-containing protein n=1 Tax=Aerococcus sanguinicola TaxID=119206 RepID=A0A5N1GQP2_9LACT|nr:MULTISPECIES: hypothetical protein [Aerococcus]KAA9302371.1 hypothetical protein F6I03_03900 [Aerococcus sanguinicola]MDK6369743.1 hypothetical protein [Aerococcus sp. UMB9870]MDK6680383.1 hypothetical protein [Aerococcus sp. UMB8608]MDK6687120.1 hypothetical protein [Aerococcus sp. UMB8623]MDK6940339.1 hypothetical protein [Aerococcus sp. UMB8487]
MKKRVIASVGLAALLVALNVPNAAASQSLFELNPNEASQAFLKQIPVLNQLSARPQVVTIETTDQVAAPIQSQQAQPGPAFYPGRAPEAKAQPAKRAQAPVSEVQPSQEAPETTKAYLMAPSQDSKTGRTQYEYRADSPDSRISHLEALYQVDEATGQVYQMDILTGQWVLLE